MIFTIFIKEVQYNVLNAKLIVTWAFLILLFLVNALSSSMKIIESSKNNLIVEQENTQKLIYDEEAGLNREFTAKLNNQPFEKKNSLNQLVFLQQVLVKRELPLSFFSGTETGIPNGSSMKYFNQPTIETIQSSSIYMDSFYSLSWSSILIYVLSFVVVCFSFDAFSGEKEKGTLKLLLSNKVSRISIVLGKYFGLLTVFIIPLLIGLIIELLVVLINPELSFSRGTIPRIIFILLVSLFFISLNILSGYLVSCLSKTSSISLSISLVIWTILAIVFPNVSWLGITKIRPIPTIAEINEKIIQSQADLENCFMGWNSSWAGKVPREEVIRRKECVDRRTKIENDMLKNYYNKLFAQTGTAIKIVGLSPFSSFQFLCDKITDNGYFGYLNFYEAVMDYQNEYRAFINAKDNVDDSSYHLIWNEEYFGRTFMSNQSVNSDEVPRFTFKASSLQSVFQSSFSNLLYLVLLMAILFAGVILSFIMYDVR